MAGVEKTDMPRRKITFTDEFTREALKLVKLPGAKFTHSARDMGIEQMHAATVGSQGRRARHTTQPGVAQRIDI